MSRIHSPSIIAMLYSMGPSIHIYAWRVYCNRTKAYWYPNTAHYNALCIISLHFPNLINGMARPAIPFICLISWCIPSLALFHWSATQVLLDHWGTFCAGGYPNINFLLCNYQDSYTRSDPRENSEGRQDDEVCGGRGGVGGGDGLDL